MSPASSEKVKSDTSIDDQLRPPKGAGKADESQRPVSEAEQIVWTCRDNPTHVVEQQRILALLRDAQPAARALQHFTDNEVLGRCWRVVESGGLVRFADRSQPAGDRRCGEMVDAVCDVEGNGLRGGREGGKVVGLAPGLERPPVIAVGFARRVSFGGVHEVVGLADQIVQAGGLRGERKLDEVVHG